MRKKKIQEEKREFPRLDQQWPIQLSLPDGSPIPASNFRQYTHNISVRGICFQTQHQLQTGTLIQFEMQPTKSTVSMKGLAKIIWCREKVNTYYSETSFDVGAELIPQEDKKLKDQDSEAVKQ